MRENKVVCCVCCCGKFLRRDFISVEHVLVDEVYGLVGRLAAQTSTYQPAVVLGGVRAAAVQASVVNARQVRTRLAHRTESTLNQTICKLNHSNSDLNKS